MESPATALVVKVTCGTEALERLNQGFTVAAAALASGLDVSLWLTGDATWMAVPGRAEDVTLPHAAPLAGLRDALLEGARVTVCGQCAARRDIAEDDLLPGASIRGAAAFVEEVVAPGARALVY
ncbi:DsrE family protein [Oryzobacter telluris]|uniref:DsrE family protein n=1 Tax=Oryzobacter telluris TaxID=3149179 RepID=UPI00370DC2E8